MSIIVIHCPTCGEGRHRVEVGPEDPRVDYYADGTGYPGYPPQGEIVDSSCDCADEDEDLGRWRMKAVDHTAMVITAVVYAGCADAVAGVITSVAQEAEKRGDLERAVAAKALAGTLLKLQHRVSEECSQDLAAVRRN